MKPIFLRNAYNYDKNKASTASGLTCLDESRTDQSFREECDINTIVRNFGVTGNLPEQVRTPLEGDFTTVTDYQTALNMVIEADAAFAQMPSAVRERFGNDAARFVAFASDPANLEECGKLGLAEPRKRPPEPLAVRITEPTPNNPSNPPKGSQNASSDAQGKP